MRKKEKQKKNKEERMAICVISGLLLTILIILALTAIGAAVVSAEVLPENMEAPLVTVACLLGSFAGAVRGAVKSSRRKMITALLVAVSTFIVLTLVSAFDTESQILDQTSISNFIAIVVGGIAGGFLCAGKKRRKVR